MPSPRISIQIDLPTPLLEGSRLHDRLIKRALRTVVEWYWRTITPQHFTKAAHQKYGYAPRSLNYMKAKAKKYHSTTDLVRSGRTRDEMVRNSKITVSGGAKRETAARLILRFPFAGGSLRFRKPGSRQAVTIEQMAHEVTSVTWNEPVLVSERVALAYQVLLDTELSKRQKRECGLIAG